MPPKAIGPGTRVGEYILEKKIGEGGFSAVWRATHHTWKDRVVAVKIPTDCGQIDELRKEAEIQRALEKLDDKHIVKTLGLDATHDPPYFVMEFVQGRSLRAALVETGAFDLPAVVDTAIQILKALEHAHGAGVIHMDLKPENILITGEGVVKLMDFGMGFRPKPQEASMLLSGDLEDAQESMGGTLEYMAPEIRGGDPPDPRADIYAFGVILFELLTGERPQPGDVPSDLNPAAPARLDRVFDKCYARIQKRYRSATEVRVELETMQPSSKKETPLDGSAVPAAARMAPPGMILIPEGSFTLGAGEGGDQGPAHERFLDAFFLDARPVTNGQFLGFILDGGYVRQEFWREDWDKVEKFKDTTGSPGPKGWSHGKAPSWRDRHPVVGISFYEATAFARWAGKRLPSEEEWEKAAKGDTRDDFPWGKNFDKGLCNTRETGVGETTPAGKYRKGKSPYGVLDMAGNVLEWTQNFFNAYPGNEEESPYFGEFYRVLRGGAWYFRAEAARTTVRHYLRPDLRLDYVGFRCARDA